MTNEGPALAAAPALLRTHPWADLPPGPAVMGILNVTPDSFSDGGQFRDASEAIAAGIAMAAEGAAIVDVGGESTRPRSAPVRLQDEIDRVVPVVAGLARAGVRVSVDTRRARTMQAALDAGAAIVNDISALTFDSCASRVVARAGCPVILMHMRGTPETMLSLARYGDVSGEVAAELADRVRAAQAAGIDPHCIALDPGIGFAKNGSHNIAMIRGLKSLTSLGHPVIVGVSRKAFIGHLSGVADPAARVAGSIAAGLCALSQGAAVLRVHDVAETVRAVRVWHALTTAMEVG